MEKLTQIVLFCSISSSIIFSSFVACLHFYFTFTRLMVKRIHVFWNAYTVLLGTVCLTTQQHRHEKYQISH